MSNNNTTARHDGYYVAVFMSREAAEANDRSALVAVQSFGQGDFDGLEAVDASGNWQDGDILSPTCFLRVCRKKTRQPPQKLQISAINRDAVEDAETLPL